MVQEGTVVPATLHVTCSRDISDMIARLRDEMVYPRLLLVAGRGEALYDGFVILIVVQGIPLRVLYQRLHGYRVRWYRRRRRRIRLSC